MILEDGVEENAQTGGIFDVIAGVAQPGGPELRGRGTRGQKFGGHDVYDVVFDLWRGPHLLSRNSPPTINHTGLVNAYMFAWTFT